MIVAITGHQRWPEAADAPIRAGIAAALAGAARPLVGATSLAAGADQLFARMVLEAGGALHVVVPCARYEEAFADEAARGEYRYLLAQAAESEQLAHAQPSEEAYAQAGFRVVDLCDLLIAVWDGAPARGKGGTGEVVNYARQRGKPVGIVWPGGVKRQ